MSKVALVVGVCLGVAQDQTWEQPSPEYEWSFPRDHWSHNSFRTEWWYITGFLDSQTDPAHRFAYQFTFFRIGVSPESLTIDSQWSARNVVMGHAALTDLRTGAHHFAETFFRSSPMLAGVGTYPDSTIAWARAEAGSIGEWRLQTDGPSFRASMEDQNAGISMDLTMRPTKPLVFQGPRGFSKKDHSGTAASMYYTFPRMTVGGVVTTNGERTNVGGTGWMDREFSSGTLGKRQIGWHWFGLQLDDGRDVMLYVLRDSTGATDYAHATLIDETGRPSYLPTSAWTLDAVDTWTSLATNITYPQGWKLKIDTEGIAVDLTPLTPDQENTSSLVPQLNYWEGAVMITDENGIPRGRGFAELTGYGGSRPAI